MEAQLRFKLTLGNIVHLLALSTGAEVGSLAVRSCLCAVCICTVSGRAESVTARLSNAASRSSEDGSESKPGRLCVAKEIGASNLCSCAR